MREKKTARDYQVANLKNWISNRTNPNEKQSGPIRDEEQLYLGSGVDLICIAPPEPSHPIARFVARSRLVRRLFRKSSRVGQICDDESYTYSVQKVAGLSNTIIVVLGLLMLFGPMWWLNYVVDDGKRLGIITAFVFVFAVGLGLIGSGRPFETLAATAAYAAVLMVFMQKQR